MVFKIKESNWCLILSIIFLIIVFTVRFVESDWYNNIEGQCYINDNGTCEGWQFNIIFSSLLFSLMFFILYIIFKKQMKNQTQEVHKRNIIKIKKPKQKRRWENVRIK